MESTYFAIAFLSGLVPALFWVWFWLREDSRKPEPYFLIAISFIAGMAVVPMALPAQKFACDLLEVGVCTPPSTTLVISWVIIEESLKYIMALALIFWNKEVDEPIDMVIYMILVALGFAALENALFIYNPLITGQFMSSAITGGFRFLGASLLHVLASGTVGVFLALSYYRKQTIQLLAGTLGLFIAIVLHALFNFSIMNPKGETILTVFLFVWMGIILLFLLFEKVKLLERNHNFNKKLS